MSQSFDIATRPFVTWRTTAGEPAEVSVRDLFAKAHELAPEGDGGPQTTFAVVRLLLALMHQTKPECDDGEWDELWKADRFPADWLAKIDDATKGRFDLFDAKRPFMQSTTAGGADDDDKTKPPSYLVPHFATATNINFASHTADDAVCLCPACAAVGLLLLPPFCGAGGSGLMASVNSTPPTYFVPLGATLRHTLLLNWPLSEPVGGDRAAWQPGKGAGRDRIGLLEGFTWQPREVRLLPAAADGRACDRCGGRAEPVIPRVVFRKGMPASKERLQTWRDPHVCYQTVAIGKRTQTRTLIAPESDKQPAAFAGYWRKVVAALLDDRPGNADCRAVRQARSPALDVLCVVPVTRPGQDKKHLIRSDRWTLPEVDAATRAALLEQLQWVDDGLKKVDVTPRAEFERRTEGHFRELLANKGEGVAEWREAVRADVLELTRPASGSAVADALTARAAEEAVNEHFPPATDTGVSVAPAARKPGRHDSAERFVKKLHAVGARERSALKASGVRPTAPDVAAHDAFTTVFWPLRNSHLPRDPCRLFAGLYFWHPASATGTAKLTGPDLGAALARAAGGDDTARERNERLLRQLVSAPSAGLPSLLMEAVRVLAAARVCPGWPRLLADLIAWNRDGSVQARWAASFLNPRSSPGE